MEVAYWQVFVFLTVAGVTAGLGARAGFVVAIGWTIFSAAMISTSPLMVLQLGTTWVSYLLFREMGSNRGQISIQEEKISELEYALLDYDYDAQNQASRAAERSRYEVIRDQQHKDELLGAVANAKTSLAIVSGWIRSYVVDRKLVGLLTEALARGVDVFIGYGWQRSDGTHDSDRSVTVARQRLEKLSTTAQRKTGWGQLTLKEIPTHEKVLIKDSDYVICGSNNWLSNKNFKNQEQSIKIWDETLARQMSDRYFGGGKSSKATHTA